MDADHPKRLGGRVMAAPLAGNKGKKMWPFQKKNPIEEFWSWFEKNGELFRDPDTIQNSALDRLRDQLQKVDQGLTYELGVANGRTTEIVISADGNKKLFPKVFDVVNAAPNLIDWKVTAFRLRVESSGLGV